MVSIGGKGGKPSLAKSPHLSGRQLIILSVQLTAFFFTFLFLKHIPVKKIDLLNRFFC